MIPGRWKAAIYRVVAPDVEFDIEYDNGWRETVVLRSGEEFKMPFTGVIVEMRRMG